MAGGADAAVAGSEITVFPEAAMRFFGPPEDDLTAIAEPLDGPFVETLSDAARKHATFVVAGMIEKIEDAPDVYNTVVVVSPAGEVVGSYRKLHLFDAFDVLESTRVRPGDRTVVLPIGEHTVGLMACYDIRFPELPRALVDQGADVILVPSAWRQGMLKEDHWRTLIKARAIENTVWMVGAAQVGGVYSGSSMIVDPMGAVRVSLGEEPGVAVASVDRNRTAAVRATLPVLLHRRFDVIMRRADRDGDANVS